MKYGEALYFPDGYEVEGFADYVLRKLAELQRPIPVPAFAAGGEAEWLEKLHDFVAAQPFAYRTKFQKSAYERAEQLTDVKPVMQSVHPTLYAVAQDCCAALQLTRPTLFSYRSDGDQRFNASVIGYMDAAWIFVSEHFQDRRYLNDLEIAAVIGHEIGHYVCCHSAVRSILKDFTRRDGRLQEYTADRAGLLAAAYRVWTVRGGELDGAQRRALALKAAGDALKKIELLHALHAQKKPDPEGEQLAGMAARMSIVKTHAKANATHPSLADRLEAMDLFANSECFCRCMRAAGIEIAVKGLEDDYLARKMAALEPEGV